jgi:hypothetical protein
VSEVKRQRSRKRVPARAQHRSRPLRPERLQQLRTFLALAIAHSSPVRITSLRQLVSPTVVTAILQSLRAQQQPAQAAGAMADPTATATPQRRI